MSKTPKPPKQRKQHLFTVNQDPDPDDLNLWIASTKYKVGDMVNYDDVPLECRTENEDKEFDQKNWGDANIEHTCIIQQPDFPQLNTALSQMATINMQLDFGSGGKFIFDTCALNAPKIFQKDGDPLVLLSLCLAIGAKFLKPYHTEVKKN